MAENDTPEEEREAKERLERFEEEKRRKRQWEEEGITSHPDTWGNGANMKRG